MTRYVCQSHVILKDVRSKNIHQKLSEGYKTFPDVETSQGAEVGSNDVVERILDVLRKPLKNYYELESIWENM